MFLVVRDPVFALSSGYRTFTPDLFPSEVEVFLNNIKKYRNKKVDIQAYQGVIEDRILQVSRAIRHPVYVIEGIRRKAPDSLTAPLVFHPMVPCLKQSGISKMYSATEIYQDISYYIFNILPDSPDILPPVELKD